MGLSPMAIFRLFDCGAPGWKLTLNPVNDQEYERVDARLAEAAALRIQEASLTGESEAVLKSAETLAAAASLGDRVDMVFKGTTVVQGTGRAIVTATGMQTEMGSIATMLDATEEEPTPLQKEVARIGRMLGVAVIVIAVMVVATVLLAWTGSFLSSAAPAGNASPRWCATICVSLSTEH